VRDYAAKSSVSATKTDTRLQEIPQGISVVGAEQIRDQGAQALQEAIRYVPGVVPDGFGFDSRGDYVLVRGIPAAYYLDGMRTSYGFYANTVGAEPYSLERIEVLRGPSSMTYGQSPSGGLISMISKMPQDFRHGEIGFDYGSYDFKQMKVDFGGPITTDGKWLGRFVGLVREAETQVDFVDNDRIFVSPSLTYRPTRDTSITVLGTIRKDQGGSVQQFLPHAGTLYPNVNGDRVSMSRFIGEPTDFNDTNQESATLLIDHKFSPALSLHHGTRYTHTDNTYSTHYTAPLTSDLIGLVNSIVGTGYNPADAPFLDPNQQNIARVYLWRNTGTDVLTSDTNLTGKFFTGEVAHKVTGGFDYTRYATGGMGTPILVDNILPAPFQSPFNIYNPTYGRNLAYLNFGTGGLVPSNDVPLDPRADETQTQTGVYIQDQMKFGPWTAILGVRQDWLTIEQARRNDVEQDELTWRAGIMYHFASGFTPYVSYSQAFAAQPGNLVKDDPLNPLESARPADPLKGDQIEIGFKYQPPGKAFAVNVSAFDLTEKNRLVDDILSGVAQQGAEVRIRGVEVEGVGRVTENIKLIGTYTFMDSEYTDHFNDYEIGTRVESIPEHMASLWAIYTFNSGFWNGLSVGAGVRYIGSTSDYGRLVTGTFDEVVTPSFTLFDAMIAYDAKDWRWQLTGTNLEDEYHVITCTTRGDCGVGQGRTVITSFTYRF
jgi:iron complex outermembrane receptor protein